MTDEPRSLLAIVEAAVAATGARTGWILRIDGAGFVVAAAAGGVEPDRLLGTRRPLLGTAGYAASSGQPVAFQPPRSDVANHGAGGAEGAPTSILASPCKDADNTCGVLELVDSGSGSFSFDDVEIAKLLSNVAAACMADQCI